MSKVNEIMSRGDTHLIAKVLLKEFFAEMKRDLPENSNLTWEEWVLKWFGDDE